MTAYCESLLKLQNMSEMGVPNKVIESPSTAECERAAAVSASPESKRASETDTGVGSGTSGMEVRAAPTKKAKKLKKKKKGGYKSFLKKAMRSGSSDKAKKEQYLQKIQRTMGGGNFAKMDDKL